LNVQQKKERKIKEINKTTSSREGTRLQANEARCAENAMHRIHTNAEFLHTPSLNPSSNPPETVPLTTYVIDVTEQAMHCQAPDQHSTNSCSRSPSLSRFSTLVVAPGLGDVDHRLAAEAVS